MRRLLPLLLLSLSLLARAQTSITFPPGMVPLTDGWKFQSGDDASWANPELNDSAWPAFNPSHPKQVCLHACWYRLHLQLPTHHPPLALLLIGDYGVAEAYIDGRRTSGPHFEPWWFEREPVEYTLPIAADAGSPVVALRIHPSRVAFNASDLHISASIGSPEAAARLAALHHARRVLHFLPSGGINLIIFLAGAGMLLVFAYQRARPEYLWLGIYLALLGSSYALLSASTYALVPGVANELFADPAIYLFIVAQIEFTYAFIRRPVNRLWRL